MSEDVGSDTELYGTTDRTYFDVGSDTELYGTTDRTYFAVRNIGLEFRKSHKTHIYKTTII